MLNRPEKPIAPPTPFMNWRNIGFFAMTHLVGLIGTPIYITHYGLPMSILITALTYFVLTGMAITVGYHRLYAHRTFQAHPVIHFWVLFFGAASFEESAFVWASQHRIHHQYVDTDLDPYSIKKGFFYAHMGWMMFWKHDKTGNNVKDLTKSTVFMHQHRWYVLWGIGAGIVIPTLIGWAFGHPFGAFIIAVCARITLVYQGTFCINSVCHTFGKPAYDYAGSARDNWFTALFTWGEGYHSFHHRFPNDYRNGISWFAWDPSKWLIFLLGKCGLTSNIRRACPFLIIKARLSAENAMAEHRLERVPVKSCEVERALNVIREKHAQLHALIHEWETRLTNYRKLNENRAAHSQQLIKNALLKVEATRQRFTDAHKEWQAHLLEVTELALLRPVAA